MTEKRFKAQERRIARILGGRRVTQNMGKGAPDVVALGLVVEVKDTKQFPMWLLGAVNQAKSYAQGAELAIAVITGPTSNRDLVIMDIKDFVALRRGASDETQVKP